MKRWNSILALGAVALLLLALFIPAGFKANADGERTFLIAISKTIPAYGDDGKAVGTLNPNVNQKATYTSAKTNMEYPVEILYVDTGDSIVDKGKNLVGKTEVRLYTSQANMLASTDAEAASSEFTISAVETIAPESTETVSEATPTPTAEPTPTPIPTATPEPDVPDHVWIETDVVVASLLGMIEDDQITIADLEAQIENLSAESTTHDQSSDQPTISIITDGENDQSDTSLMQSGVFQTIFWYVIGLLGIGLLAWIAVSASSKRTHRKELERDIADSKQTIQNIHTKVENIPTIQDKLNKLEENIPQKAQIAQVVEDGKETKQGVKQLLERKEPTRPDPLPPPPQPLKKEGMQPDLIALANRLSGIGSQDEWFDLVNKAGFHAKLLQANLTSRNAWIEDKNNHSTVACLMRSVSDDVAYMIPSFNDALAHEDHLDKFYDIGDDPSVTYYKIDLLAVMHVAQETHFTLQDRGKMTLGR